MLADAVAAEAYKFLRQRGGLFWGFCAVPLGMLVFHFGMNTWARGQMRFADAADLGAYVIDGFNGGSSAFFQIFFIAGAVSIFSGEYRFETWRLLTPRNSRSNLLLAKMIVYAGASGLSLLALGLFYGLNGLYAGMTGGGLLWPSPQFLPVAGGVFLVNWAEILALGMFAALVAVSSRAMIGPLIATISFAFAQTFSMLFVAPMDERLLWLAAFPGRAAFHTRFWLSGAEIGPGVHVNSTTALLAIPFLLAWIVLLGGATLVRFQRQDLPRE